MDSTFKYRSTVNKELAARYEWEARYRGATEAKNHAATAKRMATQLFKTLGQFERTLGPEQKLAMQAAASVMKTLGKELDQVADWSKGYKLHCDQVSADAEAQRLDEIALQRWAGNDEEMLREASALIEFREKAGEEWLRLTKQLTGETLVCGLDAPHELIAEISKPANRHGYCTRVRRLAAQTWSDLAEAKASFETVWKQNYYHAGGADYEAWWASKKSVMTIVQSRSKSSGETA